MTVWVTFQTSGLATRLRMCWRVMTGKAFGIYLPINSSNAVNDDHLQ